MSAVGGYSPETQAAELGHGGVAMPMLGLNFDSVNSPQLAGHEVRD
jgi:hypothetical protein